MNRLPIEKRTQIITLLVEGMSMRAVSRVADVSINTVTKQLEQVGAACATFQDKCVRCINAKRVQCDEIWAFCHSKERDVPPENKGILGFGDVYTWTGMDADSKLMIGYMVGKRDADYADAFIIDLAARLTSRVQLSIDGHKPYLEAVEGAFSAAVDYEMLVKHYGPGKQIGQRRYSPAEFVSADKRVITGDPDMDKVSTSFVERQNLTTRMDLRHFTRLSNGFSKKVENLEHAVSLHFMHYNFARIHKTLRVTPAMEAGISDHVWSLKEIAASVPEPIAKKRGGYN
jgi:IS1 family transposase/lambda repressor-like predicted transcriptional regulator